MATENSDYQNVFNGLRNKIRLARQRAASTVNTELLAIYWEVGNTILQQNSIKGWGAKVIGRLVTDLKLAFPDMKGFSQRNLEYMQTFASDYPQFLIPQPLVAEIQLPGFQQVIISQTLLAQLSWTHHITLLDKIKEMETRLFYMQKTVANGWSRNILLHQIESKLHLRQGAALTNFEITLPKPDSDLARETLKNPYLFDFLSIGKEMQERELEKALIVHIKKFLLELGKGFAYVGNQYNLSVAGDDYFLDLLFYNFHLHCFIVFELKVGPFKPEYIGKLNFYINTVNEQIKGAADKPTIGVLLCKTPNDTVVKIALQGITTPIGVAEYQLSNDYQFADAIPAALQSNLPSIEDLEQALEKEMELVKSPLQEKLAKLEKLMAESGREAIQKEKDNDDVRYIFNEVIPQLEEAIKTNLALLFQEFTKIKISKKINDATETYFQASHLDDVLMNNPVYLLGLMMDLEGFKKAGTDAFDMWKELLIQLHPFKYAIGKELHKPWVEKLYHQKLTKEQIQELADRWCEELIDDLTERLSRTN